MNRISILWRGALVVAAFLLLALAALPQTQAGKGEPDVGLRDPTKLQQPQADSYELHSVSSGGGGGDLANGTLSAATGIGQPMAGELLGDGWQVTGGIFSIQPGFAPGTGVNTPAKGADSVERAVHFVTTCSDPDGWRDIHTIDFKIARVQNGAEQVILQLQLDQDRGVLRFYDPATASWSEGTPGTSRVLTSRYAELYLADSRIAGHGPTDPTVDVTWSVVFKEAAAGIGNSQYLQITDDSGLSRGLAQVGSWSVISGGQPCANRFSDVQQADFFYSAVAYLTCAHAISGYDDGMFRPYNGTTRGQMVKIVVLAYGFGLFAPATPTFGDVPRESPFYVYVETAASRNIVNGYDDGTFRTAAPVTRGQLSKIVVLAAAWPLLRPPQPTFADLGAHDTFFPYVETAAARGVVGGYDVPGGRAFHPYAGATRGQIAKIVYLAVIAAQDKLQQK